MDISEAIRELYTIQENCTLESTSSLQVKPDVKYLHSALSDKVATKSTSNYAKTIADSLIDASWEQCNVGHWSEVPETPKLVYARVNFQKVILCLLEAAETTGEKLSLLNEAVKSADLGLMLGDGFQSQLSRAASLVAQIINDGSRAEGRSTVAEESLAKPEPVARLYSDESITEKLNYVLVERSDCPSIEQFNTKHFTPRSPVVLTGCMNHWPAMTRWNDLEYLMSVAGPRTVPIEIGSSYTQKDWGMELSTVRDFIQKHILKKSPRTGYLAQHQLFDQIPELRKDLVVPDYCCLTDTEDDDCDVSVNAWFGPAHTVTPLHHDPKHNLLCQVVGTKRVVLFSPDHSEFLYPHDESMLDNTAKVDPYNPDYQMFPNFKHAVAHFCKLQPGEMLYIPPKWWHHVMSTDVSFSVSFWWE